MTHHEKYMQRCLQLAQNGLGNTYPNPLVGCVIVLNDEIIGEGWHFQSGLPHAEVNAINSVVEKNLLQKATLYVNLEPCSHFGKTPPCANLIIENQIPNVVIGCVDSFSEVSGKGIERLINAGVHVEVGVLEAESLDINKRFFTYHNKKRPYVILKWAETKDGFIAPEIRETKNPHWITNQYSRQLVHKWRTEEQVILLGTNSVVADNPKLNVRDYFGNLPVRVIVDRTLKINPDYHILDGTQKTIILNEKEEKTTSRAIYKKINFTENISSEILTILYEENIQSVIIEGGTLTLNQFIASNLWDEAIVFKSNGNFINGIKAPTLNESFDLEKKTSILNDDIHFYKNNSFE